MASRWRTTSPDDMVDVSMQSDVIGLPEGVGLPCEIPRVALGDFRDHGFQSDLLTLVFQFELTAAGGARSASP